ncbi:MAG: ABC transporter ATP-binding protein [Actinobacteria bacterium]|nr:ABC transporter ATP-binding protein [Actinomycetota bacterium]
MADEHEDLEVVEDADWYVDDDGTEYFIDDDGTRFELGDDGYAYAVEDAAAAEDDGPSPFSPDAEATGRDADVTTEIPTVRVSAREPEPVTEGSDAPVLLELDNVKSGYGSLPVLHGVSATIRQGETAVLLGLNGAGKTTTALNICGALRTWDGTITFDGQDITKWGTKKAVANGIVMCPEGRRVFPDLSVGKNLQIGAWSQRKERDYAEEQRERVFGYFPRLGERVNQLAGTLSGGEQQMLAVGRALMAKPKLLIVDEASMGLAPVIVHDVFEIVRQINQDGTTVLMIEQNVGALDVADVGLVMEQGRMVKELRGERLRDTDEVTSVLMG